MENLQQLPNSTKDRIKGEIYLYKNEVRRWSSKKLERVCIKCFKKRPSFCKKNETEPKYCSDCNLENMIDVVNKRCIICNKKAPSYNYSGEKKATYCGECKLENMINVKNKKCIVCKIKQPSFNFEGEKKATHCGTCKEEGMIDVISKKCIVCNKKIPIFNYPEKKNGIYCSDCKLENMVDVINKKCIVCKIKEPYYNFKGEKKRNYCGNCKLEGMINIKDKRCNDCCIFLEEPCFAIKKKFNEKDKFICYHGAFNQISSCKNKKEKQEMKKYYNFSSNLVLRAEQSVIYQINASRIGNMYRENCIVSTFDEDPNIKLFGKQKNIHNKKPDAFYIFNDFSVIIEYDEDINHEKCLERLELIKKQNNINNLYVIRINGHQEDLNHSKCMILRKKFNGNSYYDINEYGMNVLENVYDVMEDIYNGNTKEKEIKIYEINL